MGAAKLKVGDSVDCRIKHNKIVNPYDDDYDCLRTFEIIALDKWGYFLYIPHYINLVDTIIMDQFDCSKFTIDNKYIGEKMIYITSGRVYKANILDGCYCNKCGQFCYQAAPNIDGSFLCWNCSHI